MFYFAISKRLKLLSIAITMISLTIGYHKSLYADFNSEYAYYYNNMHLPYVYQQEYYNLTHNYRFTPRLAYYCVYAFQYAFCCAYNRAIEIRNNVNSGLYDYNKNLFFVRQWQGNSSRAVGYSLEIAFIGGWKRGYERGYHDNPPNNPFPSNNLDFRMYWTPGTSQTPIPVDSNDPFQELKYTYPLR